MLRAALRRPIWQGFLAAVLICGLSGGSATADLPDQAALRRTVMVPMRDGVRLATEVALPQGEGPWSAVLVRTPYGREGALDACRRFLERGCACVTQDLRGLGGSGGEFDLPGLFLDNLRDGYDAVEWTAGRPWCNGKVGIMGASGPGIAAKLALMSDPPHLAAAYSRVAASNVHRYAAYHGGVRRAHMVDEWLKGRGVEVQEWPRPRLTPFDGRQRNLHYEGRDIDIPFTDVGGWFDIFSQSLLDDFAALQGNGRTVAVMRPSAHGDMEGLSWSAAAEGNRLLARAPRLRPVEDPSARPHRSVLYYYLMGDARKGGPPGNVWKKTHVWPVPHTDTPWYLTADGGLRRQPPGAEEASLTYEYNPRDPVPTVGGANLMLPKGPMDQRELGEREDILRFSTPPLEEPVRITGRVRVKLHVSSDVPDTTFMAGLIDVYPDGYQALILDSAVMARYRDGMDDPKPMEPGEVYEVTVDLWSTALVFDRGHRIAVHVTSSNSPRYEVHPNTFEPVDSYEDAPVAHNSVHLSSEHPSRVILPIVEPDAAEDCHP